MQRFLAQTIMLVRCNMCFRNHINSLAGIAALGVISTVLFGCGSYRGIGVHSTDQNLSEAFLAVALGREGRFADDVLSKWCGPVGVTLPETVPPGRRTRMMEELFLLSRLTTVDFQVDTKPGIEMHYPATSTELDALIVDLPIPSAVARRRVASASCFFVLQTDRETGCLRKADIVLPAALDDSAFDHCVAEEFSQAMGLPNDIDAGEGSIFSRSGRASARTTVDDIFLRTLYDPEIAPGTERPELEELVPTLIGKHR
ncbi:DUF2927 domain-containing protein [Hwanghaeella sp.]|uniref:DUF2927 domain-containing protein n=1 Tax=Hwanghaeella sp. TaxID=2605943 RepID=UPI003CCC0E1B